MLISFAGLTSADAVWSLGRTASAERNAWPGVASQDGRAEFSGEDEHAVC
jgi:hypothetical protein